MSYVLYNRSSDLNSIIAIVALIAFFISSSILTKVPHIDFPSCWHVNSRFQFKSSKKKSIEEEFKEGGQRNWEQVFANGGWGTVCAALYLYYGGGIEVCLDFHEHYLLSAFIAAFIGYSLLVLSLFVQLSYLLPGTWTAIMPVAMAM